MSGSQLGVLVAILGLSITAFWFGVNRRRKAETEVGIQSLANMKWRECISVVLEALHREGYRQCEDAPARGDGGTELLLIHENERVLLGYKHGTAYHLSSTNVQEFANALRFNGAQKGLLLTLGSADGKARAAANSCNVQLIDGKAVWAKVREFIRPQTLEMLRDQAIASTRKGVWTGAIASILLGIAIYFVVGNPLPAPASPDIAAVPGAWMDARAGGVPSARSDEATLKQINATAQAMAEVARLSDADLTQRRAAVAKQIALMDQIDTAGWSAQRTLLVTLNRTDGKDKALISEVCRILTQYEEMRFTRVQLDPPADSGRAVRWRLCE